jgi:hypothetical protein
MDFSIPYPERFMNRQAFPFFNLLVICFFLSCSPTNAFSKKKKSEPRLQNRKITREEIKIYSSGKRIAQIWADIFYNISIILEYKKSG